VDRERKAIKKYTRQTFTWEQLCILERVFESAPFPWLSLRLKLAEHLGITPRCVQVWYQNRRQKAKNQQEGPGNDHGSSTPRKPPANLDTLLRRSAAGAPASAQAMEEVEAVVMPIGDSTTIPMAEVERADGPPPNVDAPSFLSMGSAHTQARLPQSQSQPQSQPQLQPQMQLGREAYDTMLVPQTDHLVLTQGAAPTATAHAARSSISNEQNLALLFMAEQAQSVQINAVDDPMHQPFASQLPATLPNTLRTPLTTPSLPATTPQTSHALQFELLQQQQFEVLQQQMQQQLQAQQAHFETTLHHLHDLHAHEVERRGMENEQLQQLVAQHLAVMRSSKMAALSLGSQVLPAVPSVQGVQIQSVQGVPVQDVLGTRSVQQLPPPALPVPLQPIQLMGVHEGRPVVQVQQHVQTPGTAALPPLQRSANGTLRQTLGAAGTSAFSAAVCRRPQV